MCSRLGSHSGEAPDQRCAVVGYDGSGSSAAALAYAGGWAERNRAAVVIVHVDGDVADQLERVATAVRADVIVVGRSAQPTIATAPDSR